jgi:hypothetical protein
MPLPRFGALAAVVAAFMSVGCTAFTAPSGWTQEPSPSPACELPLAGPAAAATCTEPSQVLRREETGGGRLYRIAIPMEDPSVVMSALTRAALDHRGEAAKLTFLAYGDAAEATSDTYTRGRLSVDADGNADYEVCTMWMGSGSGSPCADHISFSVDIFD